MDLFEDVEGYVVVCEDFHGFMGPVTRAQAEEAVTRLNASGPCVYRVVVNATLGVLLEQFKKITEGLN